jgi:hypothetical protein
MRKFLGVTVIAGVLALPSAAGATVVAPTDYDVWFASLSGATTVVGPVVIDSFEPIFPPPATMGTLTGVVLYDPVTDLYTYVNTVNPSINNISEFNTQFDVLGFTEAGSIAGWEFDDAAAAGLGLTGGGAFGVSYESDGTIDWEGFFLPSESSWDSGEAITFFFVSTRPPTSGQYGLINGEAGGATTYAPIPEPGSMALIGAGLLGLAGAIRRKRSRVA